MYVVFAFKIKIQIITAAFISWKCYEKRKILSNSLKGTDENFDRLTPAVDTYVEIL